MGEICGTCEFFEADLDSSEAENGSCLGNPPFLLQSGMQVSLSRVIP